MFSAAKVCLRRTALLKPRAVPRYLSSPSAVPPHPGRVEHDGVARWLFGCSALVFGMVSVGGVTRLTKSGLSMTDWKPLGGLPPMTAAEWSDEFERYKQFPEFRQRQSMTLDEFKFIFYWEWGHRMMGRFIGVAFALPMAYFAARGRIPGGLTPRLGLLFTMGGTQGLVGWWMVKSGLEVSPEQRKEIRVSPYRLATHLGMAFATYALLFHTAVDTHYSHGASALPARQAAAKALQRLREAGPQVIARAGTLRGAALALCAATYATAVSGAFVAGNDAGRAYNVFPKMTEDSWLPNEPLFDPAVSPWYRNFFENTPLVQLDHRVLATSTAAGTFAALAYARMAPGLWAALTPTARAAITATAGVSAAQVSLGIATLLAYVPLELAAAHQAGSLVLLSSATWMLRSLGFASQAALRAPAAPMMAPGMAFGAASIAGAGALLAADTAKAQEGGRGEGAGRR